MPIDAWRAFYGPQNARSKTPHFALQLAPCSSGIAAYKVPPVLYGYSRIHLCHARVEHVASLADGSPVVLYAHPAPDGHPLERQRPRLSWNGMFLITMTQQDHENASPQRRHREAQGWMRTALTTTCWAPSTTNLFCSTTVTVCPPPARPRNV